MMRCCKKKGIVRSIVKFCTVRRFVYLSLFTLIANQLQASRLSRDIDLYPAIFLLDQAPRQRPIPGSVSPKLQWVHSGEQIQPVPSQQYRDAPARHVQSQ